MENLENPPGLPPDDPHAPRRYPRDLYADGYRRPIHESDCACSYCTEVTVDPMELVK